MEISLYRFLTDTFHTSGLVGQDTGVMLLNAVPEIDAGLNQG